MNVGNFREYVERASVGPLQGRLLAVVGCRFLCCILEIVVFQRLQEEGREELEPQKQQSQQSRQKQQNPKNLPSQKNLASLPNQRKSKKKLQTHLK